MPENQQNSEDENLFEELNAIAENLEEEMEISLATQQSMVELKSVEFWPIFDEYYGSSVVGQIEVPDPMIETQLKGAKKPKLKDPKGGLTAAGRAYFKRKEGANLKPGVRGPADTPEKMRRKGSFLTRFFTNPSGPMVDDKGRATRLALSAAAWGEPVPKNAEDASALAAKGRRLLEKYANSKKKKSDAISDIEYKAALGPTIGQSAGVANSNPNEAVDKDQDGLVFDGTDKEQRKPKKYEKLPNSFLEKRRRRFVRDELKRRGIAANPPGRHDSIEEHNDGSLHIYDKPNRGPEERLARSDARDAFNVDEDRKKFVRNQLRRQGITPTAKGSERSAEERAARKKAREEYDRRLKNNEPKKPKNVPGPTAPKPKYPEGYEPGKPADRYPEPKKDTSWEDNEERRQRGLRKESSSERAERQRQERMKPADTSSQRAEDARNAAKRPNPIRKPADRYPSSSDRSSEIAEDRRNQAKKPKPKAGPPAPKGSVVGPTFPLPKDIIKETFGL